MPAFLLRRFLSSIVVLFCVVSVTFLLSVSQKGGPFEKEKMTAEAKAEKERKYDLDGPKWWQLVRYEKKLFFRGDLGPSLRYMNLTVSEILGQKLPNSLTLGAASFFIASIGGVVFGFVAAMRKNSVHDVGSMFFALAAISIPTFITGPLMIAAFGLWLGWLPIGGFGTLSQLMMPSVCLALPFLAYVARLTRNSLLDVMSQNYMRTAKAKGLDDASALAKHALKVAILPVITYLGPMAAYVLTGSFVVESVFNISGVGMVFVNAIQNIDPFLLTGAVIVYSALLVFFNLVVDVTYTFLDNESSSMPEVAANRWTGAPPNGWDVLRRNRVAMVSLWFLVAVALFAFITPFFLSDAVKQVSEDSFFPPFSTSPDGSRFHLLGTDVNGQDLFYRLLTGAQVSLGVGLIAALVSLVVGGAYGMISGYAGGRVDGGMMRFVDILNSVPSLLFVMIFISAFDGYFKDGLDAVRLWAQEEHWAWLEQRARDLIPYSRIAILVLSLGFVQWLTMARIVRGQVLVLKELAFVTAARTMGQRGWVILWKHLWPNLSTIVLTYLTLTIPAVIRDESFLSFLGLGIEDPAASWGSLLKDGAQVINPLDSKWWLLAFPATLMSASLLALNFLGDGLRDAFDPRSGD